MRIFSLFLLLLSSLQSYEIALTAIFRDEARFLKEWIEYHRLIGVEHFYLTNHLSQDNYEEILKPYIDQGIVELRHEMKDTEACLSWNRIQIAAYNWALEKSKRKANWLIVIDTDEFIVPKGKETLRQILKDFEHAGAMAVNWQMFGTSFVNKVPSRKLMIETLLLRAPRELDENLYTKLIVRPERTKSFKGPHVCQFLSPFVALDLSGKQPVANRSTSLHIERIQINHYWSRDEDFFYNVKLSRKKKMGPWFPIMEKKLASLNHEPDDAILPFVEPLKKRLGF